MKVHFELFEISEQSSTSIEYKWPFFCSQTLIKFLGLTWDQKCLTPNKSNKSPIKTITNINVRNPINNLSVNSSANYEKYLSEMFNLLN